MSTARETFIRLDTARSGVLDTARTCAALTLPSVLPPYGYMGNSDTLPTPWQSTGARGTLNLAAKLLQTLFPTSQNFFRLSFDDASLKSKVPPADVATYNKQRAAIEQNLVHAEDSVQRLASDSAVRQGLFEMLVHLIITGNSLVRLHPDAHIQLYRLDSFVVERAGDGKVTQVITKEAVVYDSLSPENKALLDSKKHKDNDILDLYTLVSFSSKGRVEVTQEIDDIEVLSTSYSEATSPYIVLRWTKIASEDYGRGLIESYLGDLKVLESLSKSMTEAAVQAARVIWTNPQESLIDTADLVAARNGDVLEGRGDAIKAVQLQKQSDFSIVMQYRNIIETNLKRDFMMFESVTRNAERVTAEEIIRMSQELEVTFGGIYSLLAAELQKPLATKLVHILLKKGVLPKSIDEMLRANIMHIQVITGLEALGRGSDYQKLLMFLQSAVAVPNSAAYINAPEVLRRTAVAIGVKEGVVLTDEEIQEQQQQQAMLLALTNNNTMGGM